MRYGIVEIVLVTASEKKYVKAYFRKKGKGDPVDMELFGDEKSKTCDTFDVIDKIISIFNRNGYAFRGQLDRCNFFGTWSLFQWLRVMGRRIVFGQQKRYIVRHEQLDKRTAEKDGVASTDKRPGSVREEK